MQELTRRVASAKSWGIEPVALLTPAEVRELVPYLDESVILGGFHTPGAGVVDSLQAGTLMREARSRERRADGQRRTPRSSGSTSSTAACGACARRAATSRRERVVICCGVWSPRIARDGRARRSR